MKKWSIRTKLILLSGSLLTCLTLIAGLSYFAGVAIRQEIVDLAETQLPAVKNMTLADMMHDELRAIVFHGFFVADGGTSEAKREVAAEFKEAAANFEMYMKSLSKLNLNEKTKQTLEQNKPKVESYIVDAKTLIEMLISNRRDQEIGRASCRERVSSPV